MQVFSKINRFRSRARINSIGQRSLALLVMALITLVTPFAHATTWFVNNQIGQDTNTGLSRAMGPEGTGPFRTIQHALKVATAGDSIVLENTGTDYKETISICGPKNSGFPGIPFRIIGNGAILSGTVMTPANSWEFAGENLFRFRPENAAYQQLYLGKRPAKFATVEGDDFDSMPALSWTLQDGMVYFKSEEGILPSSYALSHCFRQTGITLYAVKYVSIENLIVQGFYLDGVNAHDNVKNAQLVGVTTRGNGRSGVSVGGCSRLSLNSCLLGDNQYTQLRTETVAKVELAGCSLLENSQGPVIDRLGGEITESASVGQPPVPAAEKPIGSGVESFEDETESTPEATEDPFGDTNDDPFAG